MDKDFEKELVKLGERLVDKTTNKVDVQLKFDGNVALRQVLRALGFKVASPYLDLATVVIVSATVGAVITKLVALFG